jgi:transcription elongation factor GreB
MSKAFTREADDAPERPAARRTTVVLPPGAKNYFTPDGLKKLRAELEAASASPAGRARMLEIQQRLESAEAVPPPPLPWDQVHFGATVTVRDERGEKNTYRIVGPHEADIDRDWISYLSPLAKALLKARMGERVRFRAPGGEQLLEIIAVRYE